MTSNTWDQLKPSYEAISFTRYCTTAFFFPAPSSTVGPYRTSTDQKDAAKQNLKITCANKTSRQQAHFGVLSRLTGTVWYILRTRSSLRHGFVEKLGRNQLPDYRPYYSRFLQSTESVRGVEGGVSRRYGGVNSSKAHQLNICCGSYNSVPRF